MSEWVNVRMSQRQKKSASEWVNIWKSSQHSRINSQHKHIVIIIIIIKKGWQSKAGREWLTPCPSEDLSPTIPTQYQREISRRQKWS